MKNLTFVLLSLSFLAFANAQSFTENPIDYFIHLNKQHTKFGDKNLEYLQYSVHSEDISLIEEKRKEVIQRLNAAIAQVARYPTYEGDDAMRSELMAVLRVYIESFKGEFNDLNKLKANRYDSFEAMQQYFDARDMAEQKLVKASERYIKAQETFAKKHELILHNGKNELQINRIHQVHDYQRLIFMRYFKVYLIDTVCYDIK